MSGSNYIPVGLRDGKLVVIHELSIDESGDRCNCICPECKLPLIACSMNGRRIKHFRHKSGEQHCHFKLDTYLMDYIMGILSTFDSIPELSEDDFIGINVKSKLKPIIYEDKDISTSRRSSFKVVEVQAQRVKIKIDDTEFWISFNFKKRNSGNSDDITIIVDLSDLIENGRISNENWGQIREIAQKRIAQKFSAKILQQLDLNEVRTQENQNRTIENRDKEVATIDEIPVNKNIDFQPDYSVREVHNGQCPVCRKGTLIRKKNHQNGKYFFACSNFYSSGCIYTTNKYYDINLEKWFFANN